MDRIERLKKIVETHQCEKIERVLVDVQSANLAVQVLGKVNERVKTKLLEMPIKKMLQVIWQVAG